jgi:hypothetical protein
MIPHSIACIERILPSLLTIIAASGYNLGDEMVDSRKGRISRTTYIHVVGHMLIRDWFALEHCETLTQLELVGHLVAAYPNRYLSPGWAVRALLDRAIDDIIAVSRKSKDEGGQRLAKFLELRRQGKQVKEIAEQWELTREHLSRSVNRRAIELVTDRLLVLGRRKLLPVEAPNNDTKRTA